MNILLAIGVLLLDTVTVFVPLGALFIAYVILFKPKWVFEYLKKLYGE